MIATERITPEELALDPWNILPGFLRAQELAAIEKAVNSGSPRHAGSIAQASYPFPLLFASALCNSTGWSHAASIKHPFFVLPHYQSCLCIALGLFLVNATHQGDQVPVLCRVSESGVGTSKRRTAPSEIQTGLWPSSRLQPCPG